MLVELAADGSMSITFDVCEGQALVGVAVAAGEGAGSDALGQGARGDEYSVTTTLVMDVSDASLAAGRLIDGVPVVRAWNTSPPPGVADVTHVEIKTTDHAVQFDPSQLGDASGLWLVSSVPDHYAQTTITPVGVAEGQVAIASTCAE